MKSYIFRKNGSYYYATSRRFDNLYVCRPFLCEDGLKEINPNISDTARVVLGKGKHTIQEIMGCPNVIIDGKETFVCSRTLRLLKEVDSKEEKIKFGVHRYNG